MSSRGIQFIVLFLACVFVFTMNIANAQERNVAQGSTSNNGIHAEPWAFGQSADRKQPIWQKGKPGESMIPGKKKSASAGKSKKETNTSSENRFKSSLGVSLKESTGSWKVTPSQKNIRPDEEHVRENRHILGAYAGIEAGDDFNIGIGPELILKDDTKGEDSAYSDQPESALGWGMKFKYDF